MIKFLGMSDKPQIVIYKVLDNDQKIKVRIEDENVWLTQKQIAELFNVDVRTVNEHLSNIYLEQELFENSTIRNFRIVQKESTRDVSRNVKHYNLDKEVEKILKSSSVVVSNTHE